MTLEYKSMPLKVSEIFHSIQGEGQWLGVPSTFVRLSGCNLRCVWCDTPYASWTPEGEMYGIDQIIQKVQHEHVVITGGEPMIFPEVVELSSLLKRLNKTITFETAGTSDLEVEADLMSISPKLGHSNPVDDPTWSTRHEQRRWRPDVITSLMQRYSFQLKFVVGDEWENDIEEIDQMLSELPPHSPERVFLMPEGRDAQTLWKRAQQLVPICLERGWRLAPRIQIDLFGDTRGT